MSSSGGAATPFSSNATTAANYSGASSKSVHSKMVAKDALGSSTDVVWKHGIHFRDPRIVQCKFCLKIITGGGIYTLRSHLAGTGKDGDACKCVSDEVKKEMVDAVFGLQQNIIKKSSFDEEKIAKFGENAFGSRTKTWKRGTYFKRDRRNRQRKFCQKIRTGYSVDRLHFSDACKGDSGSIYGVAWKYGIRFRDPRIVQCKFCLKIITGGGIYALRSHLAGTGKDGDACKSVSDEVKKEMVDAVFGLQQNIIKKSSFGEEKIAKFGENAFGSRTKTWKRGTCFKRDRRNRQHEFCQKIRTGYAVDRLHFSDACKGDSGSIYGVAWKYGIRFRDPRIVQCKFCQKIITGGVFYFKYHLAGNDGDACKSVSDEVKKEMLDAILALQV